MPFYERGDVRIYYEEVGSGFPLLVTPGGGLNSVASGWPRQVFNAMEVFKDDFRCITMDQRNAIGGQSTGPVQVDDPWGAFADDQLGLMDHLGIGEFLFMGYCIGGPFAMKLIDPGAGARPGRRALPAGGPRPGPPRTPCITPATMPGGRSCAPSGPTSPWRLSNSTCTTSTGYSRTSCTASPETLPATARHPAGYA